MNETLSVRQLTPDDRQTILSAFDSWTKEWGEPLPKEEKKKGISELDLYLDPKNDQHIIIGCFESD